ncbi:MAG: hypothetical protein IVW56_10435 [Candidatus Binataceae bacterium]|nr:hypothetical protein [Candidatus Binataceae bacterium]
MSTITRTIVREGEMDMRHHLHHGSAGRVRQLLVALWSRTSGGNVISKPRRSVDREQQEYTPFYE